MDPEGRSARRCLVPAALLLLFLLAGAALGADEPATAALGRVHDPAIVSTGDLRKFFGWSSDRFRVVAVRDGRTGEIPFQFDEREDNGDWVVSPTGDLPPFAIDDDDELVFMAKDAGDRVELGDLPPGHERAAEIRIRDLRDGGTAWAYLLGYPAAVKERAPVSAYAHFDVATNTVRTPMYTIEYEPGTSLMTGLSISPAAGGTGGNILLGMQIRVDLEFSFLPLQRWRTALSEENFGGETQGFRNGPVRAIRRSRQSLDLGRFVPELPGGIIYSHFYFSSFVTPSEFSIPGLALRALRSMRYEGVSQFPLGTDELRYWDGANPAGFRIRSDDLGTLDTETDHEWWAVSGAGGTCLHTFLVPEDWRTNGIVRSTVLRREATSASQPSDEAQFSVGYALTGMEKLPRGGSFDLDMTMFILPRAYAPGDEVLPLAMSKQPLRTEVTRVGR